MRIIPVALFVILFLIIGIPVLGIEWLIGKISKKTMDYSSLRIVQWAFKVIVRLAGDRAHCHRRGECSGRAGSFYRKPQKLF